jgi:hypothetical protein
MVWLVVLLVVVIIIMASKSSKRESSLNVDEIVRSAVGQIDLGKKAATAEKVIQNYGAALENGGALICFPNSLLQNSKEEITRSFQTYVNYLKNTERLTPEVVTMLGNAFSVIDYFIEDFEANIINNTHQRIKNGEIPGSREKHLYETFQVQLLQSRGNRYVEFNKMICRTTA